MITKERLSGTFRLSAYWLAKMTSEFPLILVIPWATWTIVYVMIGLPYDFKLYLGSTLVSVLGAVMGQVRFLPIVPLPYESAVL